MQFPEIPGATPRERFMNLVRQVMSVPKAEIDRREAEWRKERAKKKRQKARAAKGLSMLSTARLIPLGFAVLLASSCTTPLVAGPWSAWTWRNPSTVEEWRQFYPRALEQANHCNAEPRCVPLCKQDTCEQKQEAWRQRIRRAFLDSHPDLDSDTRQYVKDGRAEPALDAATVIEEVRQQVLQRQAQEQLQADRAREMAVRAREAAVRAEEQEKKRQEKLKQLPPLTREQLELLADIRSEARRVYREFDEMEQHPDRYEPNYIQHAIDVQDRLQLLLQRWIDRGYPQKIACDQYAPNYCGIVLGD